MKFLLIDFQDDCLLERFIDEDILSKCIFTTKISMCVDRRYFFCVPDRKNIKCLTNSYVFERKNAKNYRERHEWTLKKENSHENC